MTTMEQGQRPNGVVLLGNGPFILCPICGKQIHFVKTVAGKQMPCELTIEVGNGSKTLVTHDGRTFRKASAEVTGYEPHWGYCDRGSMRPDGIRQTIIKGGVV
jgi:hypothetical protein